jgi:glycerol-3-phosphate dehydrogenase (NAD(P)+)
MKENTAKITIIGAGSWGTTLAVMLAKQGNDVDLWVRQKKTFKQISELHANPRYTGDLVLPDNIKPFTGLCESLREGTEIVIFAVPSHALREVAGIFLKPLESGHKYIRCILNVAKGLETGTNLRLSQVIKQNLPGVLKEKTCSLSGPNIAFEVCRGLPSVAVIASSSKHVLDFLQPILSTDTFRVYTNEDVAGVEIGGAVKNIIAIASGISDGLGYGVNTKASLITRGLHELSRFGTSMGANPLTFSGAAGMGDLIATCVSPHSRNRSVGERLGKGESIGEILDSMYMVAEGVGTSRAVYEIASDRGIDLPITECVYKIIYKNLSPEESVMKLMTRKFKSEIEY